MQQLQFIEIRPWLAVMYGKLGNLEHESAHSNSNLVIVQAR